MRVSFVALLAATWLAAATTADAAPCLIVTLTGTQGGPQSFNGLAGAGTQHVGVAGGRRSWGPVGRGGASSCKDQFSETLCARVP